MGKMTAIVPLLLVFGLEEQQPTRTQLQAMMRMLQAMLLMALQLRFQARFRELSRME
jgi:hypothetical protein